MLTPLIYLLAGAFGSLAKDVVSDGKIVLPRYEDGCVILGFVGGMLVGGFVGMAVDNNPLTAMLSGYVGSSAIQGLLGSVRRR